jgi:hypothetical protein
VTGMGKKNVLLSHIDFGIRARKQNKFAHVLWDHEGYGPCMWFSHDVANIRAVDFYPGIFACGESDAECKANNMEIFVN